MASSNRGSQAYVANMMTITSMLDQVGVLLGDLCAAPADTRSQNRFFDVQLERFWRSYHALKHRQEDATLSVAVLALTKSGKSTLLNALVGAELLPMNNVPETARIVKIVSTGRSGGASYMMEPASGSDIRSKQSSGSQNDTCMVVTARGEAAVRARLQELNHQARERSGSCALMKTPSIALAPCPSVGYSSSGTPPARTPSVLDDGLDLESQDDDSCGLALPTPNTPAVATGLPLDRVLSIHVPVAALLDYESTDSEAGASSGGVRLQLLDTPGPNEAGEEGLRHQVERLLDGVDAVLYLLDYTKLKTQDEAGMFERLRMVNPALVQRLSQRLFFVINKVDAALVNEGQDLEETREYVAELVTRQMGVEGFRLLPEQVLLLSARNALLSRLVLKGTAGPEVQSRFVQLAFGRFAQPSMITQEQMAAAAHALLEDSGVLDLEAQVLAYLYAHAGSVKQLALLDDLGRLLAEVQNASASCAAALSASADTLGKHVQTVKSKLHATLEQFGTVQKDADAIGLEVSKEVRSHLHTLRGKLFSAIINALDTSGPTAPPASQPGGNPISKRWWAIRERFLSIFTGRTGGEAGGVFSNQPSNISTGPSSSTSYYNTDLCADQAEATAESLLNAAAGGVVARSRNKAELASLLVSLHEDLTAQIHAEVREFWGVMEAVAAARHAELLATLNQHLAQLSTQVEAAVSRSLEVRLSPVALSLAPPDAAQFHADLDQLLAHGLVETRERHIRVNQKEVTEQVLRKGGGICRWGDYWESVPRIRTVVEAYTLSVYELVPGNITQHFISMVESAINNTQATLEAYVSQFVGQQLSEARQQLQEYSDSYLSVMTGALEASTKGSEHRLAALAQVQSFLERVKAIYQQHADMQRSLEGLMPRAQDVLAFDELCDLAESDDGQGEQEQQKGEQQQQQEQQVEEPVAHTRSLATPFALAASGMDEVAAAPGAETPLPVPAQETAQASVAPTLFAPASPPSTSSSLANALLKAPLCTSQHADAEGSAAAVAAQQDAPGASTAQATAHQAPDLAAGEQQAPDGPLSGISAASSSSTGCGEQAAHSAPLPPIPGSGVVRSKVNLPREPFDYNTGFYSAMSSSQLDVQPGSDQEGGATREGSGSDEWDLLEVEPRD